MCGGGGLFVFCLVCSCLAQQTSMMQDSCLGGAARWQGSDRCVATAISVAALAACYPDLLMAVSWPRHGAWLEYARCMSHRVLGLWSGGWKTTADLQGLDGAEPTRCRDRTAKFRLSLRLLSFSLHPLQQQQHLPVAVAAAAPTAQHGQVK